MPPKKKENKAGGGEAVEGEDPVQFLKNYTAFCKYVICCCALQFKLITVAMRFRLAGLPAHAAVAKTLNDEEKYPIEQLVLDDENGQILGPGGTRSLMTALMGAGPGMKGGPYKLLKSLRLWKCHIGDDGAASIVCLVNFCQHFPPLNVTMSLLITG